MVIPFITAVMRDVFELVPPMLKESAYGAGRDHLGSGLARGAAVHQGRRDRRHHAGPRPRARRDHGGDLRDRQRAPARGLAAWRPATASPRRSPTSSPRRSATCTTSALIELGLILFLITTIVLALLEAAAAAARAGAKGRARERACQRDRQRRPTRSTARRKRINVVMLAVVQRWRSPSACSGWSGSSARCSTKAARRSARRRSSRR